MRNCRFIASFLVILGLISRADACFNEEDIAGLYDDFSPTDKHLSPVNGLIVLRSGMLHTARFKGKFGAYMPAYLCHYSIRKPTRHQPRDDVDSPHNCTSSVIQQLLPSPAGGRLSMPGNHGDLFRLMPIREIGRLLHLYNQVRKGADAAGFEAFFAAYFNPPQQKKRQAAEAAGWALNRSHRKEMEKLWTDEYGSLPQRYAAMFAGAIKEAHEYPVHFIEASLLALACMKAQGVDDLRPLLEEVGYPKAGLNAVRRFDREFYKVWVARIQLNSHQLIKLLADPEAFIYVTLAHDVYARPFPRSLGAGKAVHTYIDEDGIERQESFSDCGESAARAFWDKVVAILGSRAFDTSHLQKACPNLSKNFIHFYHGNPEKLGGFAQLKFEDINDGSEGRSAWADVVSSLNEPGDSSPVAYRIKGRCNIKGNGFDNMLRNFEGVLGTKFVSPNMVFDNDQLRRGHAMNQLFKLISRQGHEFTWYEKKANAKVSDRLGKYGNVTIQLNGVDRFLWSASNHHFEFNAIDGQDRNDWRRNLNIGGEHPVLFSLKHHVSPLMISRLHPFFLSYNKTPGVELPSDTELMQQAGMLPDFIYGLKLYGAEETLRQLDKLMRFVPDTAVDIAPYWISKMPLNDFFIGRMIVSLLYAHKERLIGPVINETSFAEIYKLYESHLKTLRAVGLSREVLALIYASEFCFALVRDLLIDRDSEEIGSFTVLKADLGSDDDLSSDEESAGEGNDNPDVSDEENEVYNVLRVAAQAGGQHNTAELVKFLMEKAGPAFFTDETPETLKKLSSYVFGSNNCPEVFQVILGYPYARAVFFPEGADHPHRLSSIRTLMQSPWHFIALLEIPELRRILLQPEIVNPSSVESLKKYRSILQYDTSKPRHMLEAELPMFTLLFGMTQYPEDFSASSLNRLLADQEAFNLVFASLSGHPLMDYFTLNFPYFKEMMFRSLGSGSLGPAKFPENVELRLSSLKSDQRTQLLEFMLKVAKPGKWAWCDHVSFTQICLEQPYDELEPFMETFVSLKGDRDWNHFICECVQPALMAYPILAEFYRFHPDQLDSFVETIRNGGYSYDQQRGKETWVKIPENLAIEHQELAIRLAATHTPAYSCLWFDQARFLYTLLALPFDRIEECVIGAAIVEQDRDDPGWAFSVLAEALLMYPGAGIPTTAAATRELIGRGPLTYLGNASLRSYVRTAAKLSPPVVKIAKLALESIRARGDWIDYYLGEALEAVERLVPEHTSDHVLMISDAAWVVHQVHDPSNRGHYLGIMGDLIQVPIYKLAGVARNILRIAAISKAHFHDTINIYRATKDLTSYSGLIYRLSSLGASHMDDTTSLVLRLIQEEGNFNFCQAAMLIENLVKVPECTLPVVVKSMAKFSFGEQNAGNFRRQLMELAENCPLNRVQALVDIYEESLQINNQESVHDFRLWKIMLTRHRLFETEEMVMVKALLISWVKYRSIYDDASYNILDTLFPLSKGCPAETMQAILDFSSRVVGGTSWAKEDKAAFLRELIYRQRLIDAERLELLERTVAEFKPFTRSAHAGTSLLACVLIDAFEHMDPAAVSDTVMKAVAECKKRYKEGDKSAISYLIMRLAKK